MNLQGAFSKPRTSPLFSNKAKHFFQE